MNRVLKAALLSTTVLVLPAMAHAQNASQANGNACDQLLQALDKAGSQTLVTKEQAQTYKTNNDLTACQTALKEVQNSDQNQQAADQNTPGADQNGLLPGQNQQAADQNNAAQALPGGNLPGQTAQSSAPSIKVEQPAPKVTVTEAQPTVNVNPGQPQIQIHQPAPTVSINIPQPEVTITMPKPEVNVSQAQPKVSVNQQKPQVNVVPSQQQAQTETNGSAQPIVKFTADKAKVDVTQPDKPIVHFEQAGANGANTAANGLNDNQLKAETAQANPQGQMPESVNPSDKTAQATQDNGQGQMDQANPGLVAQDNAQGQMDQANPLGGQQAAGAAQQVAVSKLKGMDLMGVNDEQAVGKITAVILDANNKPFVIVDKSGQKVAVDVDYTRMKGNDLVLSGVSSPDNLPKWDDSKLQSKQVKELTGDQTISIQTAG